jgi:hypothetical protein
VELQLFSPVKAIDEKLFEVACERRETRGRGIDMISWYPRQRSYSLGGGLTHSAMEALPLP